MCQCIECVGSQPEPDQIDMMNESELRIELRKALLEAEKLEPLQRQVAGNLDLLKEIANFKNCLPTGAALRLTSALTNTQATAEAYDREHAAKVLEETKHRILAGRFLHDQAPPALFAREVASMLDRDIAELRAQSAQKKEE